MRLLLSVYTAGTRQKITHIFRRPGQNAIVKSLLAVNILHGLFQFLDLSAESFTCPAEYDFALWYALFTLKTQRHIFAYISETHSAFPQFPQALYPRYIILIKHTAVYLVALYVRHKSFIAIEFESLIGHIGFPASLHHRINHIFTSCHNFWSVIYFRLL